MSAQERECPLSPENPFREVYQAFESSPIVWGKYYFPHHFRSHSPRFHTNLINSAMRHAHLAVAAPRESAKSTILAFLYAFHCIVFRKKRFVVLVGNTFEKACEHLDAIKKELQDNEKLNKHFHISVTRDAKGDSEFRHEDGFETRVICKGVEQMGSIRGVKFKAYRPDLIIGDDMEDDELVRSPDRRRVLNEVFDQALIPAGDRELCQFIFIGTILHDDSQMAKLVSDNHYPEYKKIMYRALNTHKDGSHYSLWPEKWTVDQLMSLMRDKPGVFAKEYQNDPVSGITSKFSKDDFRYWKLENNQYLLYNAEGGLESRGDISTCRSAIACDLAWEEKKESDYSVILPAFMTPQSELLLYRYYCKKGMRPHEIYEAIFTLEEKLRTMTGESVPIGFEKAKLEKVIRHLLKEEMKRRNHWLVFRDLQWDADKIQRIVTRLEPRYASGSIYHMTGMGEYEHQLLRVPHGTHDDLPDAAAGICQILSVPRKKKDVPQEDNEFERLRQLVRESKQVRRWSGIGQRGPIGIPAKKSLW